MTADAEKIDTLLARIEIAIGELRDADPSHATLIAEILQAVNGLRSLLGVTRSH